MAHPDLTPQQTADAFVALLGAPAWKRRMEEVACACTGGQRTGRAMLGRFAIEVALERVRRGASPLSAAQAAVVAGAGEVLRARGTLARDGRERMQAALLAAIQGVATLMPLFHLARTAQRQRDRGFQVSYAAWNDGETFDLLLSREGTQVELCCDVVSAEDGRDLHRGAWVRLVDRIDPDLQTWLAAHPGRYLLKMTLPAGLRDQPSDHGRLADLHARVRTLLEGRRRADHDEAAVLRLDPLMLAASQADELGLLGSLRREFGNEAHLAVTGGQGSVFVMAARAAREDEVGSAVRRRLAAVAPARLSGVRPGIISVLVDDTDRAEWRQLRDRLTLEGEARRFLTSPEARHVVAVTCTSRHDLLGDSVEEDGELGFRNPGHPAARSAALQTALLSRG